jgi:hypothetical protein
MFGPSFGIGMHESDQYHTRQRMELAKAFEEFKKNNPYATTSDFQAWIDMASGSDNYLRGGLPGREVLGRLEQEGQERRRRDEISRSLSEMRDRADTQGKIQGLIDQSILGMDGDDFDSARTKFIQSMGGEANTVGLNIGNYFTPQYRQQVFGRQQLNLMDSVVKLMQQTRGSADAKQIAEALGISAPLANHLAGIASEEYERQRKASIIQQEDALVQRSLRDLQAGLDPSQTIRNAGIDLKDDEVKSIIDAATQLYQKNVAQQERADAQNQMAQRQTVAQMMVDVLGSTVLMQPPDEAKRAIGQWLGSNEVAFGHLNSEASINQIYDMMKNKANNARQEGWVQRQDAIRQETARMALTTREASVGAAAKVGGEAMQKARGISRFNPAIQLAVESIATRYNLLDPRTQSALWAAIGAAGSDLSDPASIEEAILGNRNFQIAAQSISSAAESRREELAAQNRKPQLFSDYLRDTSNAFGSGLKRAEERALGGLDEMQPHEIAAEAPGRRMGVERYIEHLETVLMAEYESRDRWLHTGEAWDDRNFSQLMAFLQSEKQRLLAEIDARVPEEIAQPSGSAGQLQLPQSVPPQTPQQPTGRRNRRPEGPAPDFLDTPMGQGVKRFGEGLGDMFTPAQPPPQQNRRGGGAPSNRQ